MFNISKIIIKIQILYLEQAFQAKINKFNCLKQNLKMKSSMDQLNEPDSANCAEDDGSIENRGRKQIKFYRHASQTNRNVNKLYYNTNEEDNEDQAQA